MSMPNPKKTAVRVQKVRLYPDAEMKQVLDELCDYRRYCWNEALALWNDMYEQSLILDDRKSRPSEYKVRNELVAEKQGVIRKSPAAFSQRFEQGIQELLRQGTDGLGKAEVQVKEGTETGVQD